MIFALNAHDAYSLMLSKYARWHDPAARALARQIARELVPLVDTLGWLTVPERRAKVLHIAGVQVREEVK